MKFVGRVPLATLLEEPLVRLPYVPTDVVVARTPEGELYALEDVCNHGGASLSTGWIESGCVVCPLHQYAFDLGSGALVRPRGRCGPQRAFVARLEGDEVVVFDPFQLRIVPPKA